MDDSYKLDEKIKKKFKLFQGVRPQEEDQKIFDKVADLCFEKLYVFVSENLSDTQRDEMMKELDSLDVEKDKKVDLFVEYAQKIDNYALRINSMFETYLDDLVLSSVQKMKIQI